LLALSAFISIDLSIFSASEFASESSNTHKPIDENAIRVFISYSKNNKKDAQDFKRLFEKKEPVIDGKEGCKMRALSLSNFSLTLLKKSSTLEALPSILLKWLFGQCNSCLLAHHLTNKFKKI
jgi:hypothetical protein